MTVFMYDNLCCVLAVGLVTCCVVIHVLLSTTWLVLRHHWPRFLRKNGSAVSVNSMRYVLLVDEWLM